ncbi:MAG: 50S ribosomal protein L23 [Candidatus Gracilibacteria bacterium]|nr:50S ribosomal protein L23 [Candidatus Gracilibacteria bacterium]
MQGISPIIKNLTTEKSSLAQANKQYTFLVRLDANKVLIKKAIKDLYGVEADKVTISIMPKKVRFLGSKGKVFTKRAKIKKATVSIKEGKTIDPNKFKDSKKK